MPKLFGIAADPLSLGTNYEVQKVSTKVGGNWVEIYTKEGGFLQRDSRINVHTLKVDCVLDSSGTVPARGSTINGVWVCDDTDENEDATGHRTLSIVVSARENVTLCDTLVRT